MDLSEARCDDCTLDNIVFIQYFFAKTFLSKYVKTDFPHKKSLIRLESWSSRGALYFPLYPFQDVDDKLS